MNIKRGIAIIALSLSPFLFSSKPLETKTKGTIIIEPEEFYFPSFPKATFYSKKDTIVYNGDCWGRINYNLGEGQYNIKIEPGKDLLTETKGEEFKPYKTKININRNDNSLKSVRPSNLEILTKK
ncbi:hypothetical protein GW932_02215 [archaeon]|nr:hypothetical protein [archaeon]